MFTDPRKNLEQFDIMPSMTVADFGSGAGYYTIPLAKSVGDTGKVYAIDIQKELLLKIKTDAAREHLFNVDIIWADFENSGGTHLADKIIERGVISNVLFQIKNKEVFAEEVARIMRPGGKLMVTDWTDSFGGLGPERKAVFDESHCVALFEKAGFEVEKKISAGAHHYGLIFKKKE